MVPIAVYSFKDRENNILTNPDFQGLNRKKYVFVWDFEFNHYQEKYGKWFEIISVPLEGRTRCIQEKFFYSWDFLKEKGYKSFYRLDDDVNFGPYKFSHEDDKENNVFEKITYEEFFNVIDKEIENFDGAILGFSGQVNFPCFKRRDFQGKTKTIAHDIAQAAFYDIEKCENNKIHPSKEELFEDFDLTAQCNKAKLLTYRMMTCIIDYKLPRVNSVLGQKYEKLYANTIKKWGQIFLMFFAEDAKNLKIRK